MYIKVQKGENGVFPAGIHCITKTMRMSAEELQGVLQKNKAISISAASPSTVSVLNDEKAKQDIRTTNKYYNVPVYVFSDGFVFFDEQNQIKKLDADELRKQHGNIRQKFDSIKEYEREQELKLLEAQGVIQDLQRQCALTVQEGFRYRGQVLRPIIYRADFRYIRDNVVVIEDVKGYDKKKGKWRTTQVFELKWKLLKAKYPEYVFEIV